MTSAGRSKIFENIRKSIGNNTDSASDRLAMADRRIAARDPNTVPARAAGGPDALLALFIVEAEQVDATIARVAAAADLPGAVVAYLSANALPLRLRAAPQALLENVPWSQQVGLDVTFGPTAGDDGAALSVAFRGIAETGTLALHSGPDGPTTLNFLPDHHLVVLPVSRLVGTYEAAWSALRGIGNQTMPRTVNWITGPSRSADIDQTLLMGAHGPRSLHILILDDQKDAQE